MSKKVLSLVPFVRKKRDDKDISISVYSDNSLPSAPPPYFEPEQNTSSSLDTNLELNMKVSLSSKRNVDLFQLMSAYPNLERDFVGDLYTLELLRVLLPKIFKKMYASEAINSYGVFKRVHQIECPIKPLRGISRKPLDKPVSYRQFFKWITLTSGFVELSISLDYKETKTLGHQID
ncbi:hypothetical protein 2 [Soybean thrips rhabdo-like virus 1]|uniref:Uncharacterized protein n=1 Tax=Soybean thrips rhabdo-like virus 1 TaxID=2802235 RepID=A0A7T8FZP6_9RHAB|nr:hypothetical protein 2 [Soybean thrips rhabdo-like virus 1]